VNREQAQLILAACRPGDVDRFDPQVAEAFAEVERDQELARWYAEERAFDQAIADHLAAMPAPFGLKTRLLANAGTDGKESKLRWAALIAITAAVVLLLGQLVVLNRDSSPPAAKLTDFREEMISFVRLQPPLDMQSTSLKPIQQWLAQTGAPPAEDVPPQLAALETMGCRVLSFRGHKVTLVCFCHGKDYQDIAHLFIVESAALPQMERNEPPVFAKWGDWMTATWTHDGRVYMIAVRGDREAVKTYLPSA
jgi:hypothetical protein